MSGNTSDVLIVGGGFAGIALAYHLAKSGAEVLLLEAGSICSGTSAACAGRAQIIESETDDYLDLVVAGFSRLEGLSEELGVDLEWELPGHLTLLSNQEEWRQYQALTRWLNRHGVEAEMLDLPALRAAEPNLRFDGYLGAAYSKEGHLNPFRFGMGFAHAARRHGATLRSYTRVTGFERSGSRIIRVRAGNETFSAGTTLLANGAWSGVLAEKAGGSLPMRFTHAEAVVSEPLPRFIHHHIGSSGFYEAVHGRERTVTLGFGQHPNGTLVISNAIQRADQVDRSNTAWGIPALAGAISNLLVSPRHIRLTRAWAAPSPFLPDYRPAIGWMPGLDNLYVAAGFHLAVPTIPILAEAIAALILGSNYGAANPILKPFVLERFG
jgi:glycine/D-amino acid oxidase-like deaminating enzyme